MIKYVDKIDKIQQINASKETRNNFTHLNTSSPWISLNRYYSLSNCCKSLNVYCGHITKTTAV